MEIVYSPYKTLKEQEAAERELKASIEATAIVDEISADEAQNDNNLILAEMAEAEGIANSLKE